jgi:tetratricopeptide (TPR) repeat protein
MENHSIKIADVNGDLIGAGVSGKGNFVGREIKYTVKNNVFNINNPSTDSLSELRKILLLPNEISADKDSDTRDTRTMQDLRTLEKRTEEFLNLIRAADAKLKMQTTEVRADELHFSRTDLLLKRTIVLVEQADRYWNVVAKPSDVNMYKAKPSDVNMYKAKLKEACSLLHEANQIDPYNTEVLLYLAKIQCKLMPDNQANMQKILYRIQNLLTSPNNDKEWFHLAEATFLLAITSEPLDNELLLDARTMFEKLGQRGWIRKCTELLQPENNSTIYAKLWYGKGTALANLGKCEQAIECFDKAIKINPNESDLWCSKGTALYYLGKYEESIKCYNKSIAIDPDNAIAWLCKGKVLKSLGRSEDAKDCFNRAKELDLTV